MSNDNTKDEMPSMVLDKDDLDSYRRNRGPAPVSYTHLTLPTTPYV